MGAAAAATIQINQHTGTGSIGNVKLPGAGNRFGFRGPYRPSSTDITSRQQRESHDNIENNNCAANGNNTKGVLVSNCKLFLLKYSINICINIIDMKPTHKLLIQIKDECFND